MKARRYFMFAAGILLLPTQAHADKDYYRYKLEEGAGHEVCRHMTKVFNTRFKNPWNVGWLKPEPVPTIHGTPYDLVFERLPSVKYDKRFVFDMLLSKYPTSPEFDAVKWMEARGYFDGIDSRTGQTTNMPMPVLIAKLDIDNDGQMDWVVKDGFMKMPTRDDGLNNGGTDRLIIFGENAFDPATTVIEYRRVQPVPWYIKASSISNDVIYHPTVDTYYQLRPFIYQQMTYVAGYRAIWHDRPDRRTDRHSVLPIQLFPDEEYMSILRVLPGGRKSFHTIAHYSDVLVTNMEMTCSIRMIMRNKKPTNRGER